MTDDTPRTKPPPAEPTPAAAVSTAPGGERVADDDAAVAVALGRPTPSPDQVPPPTASPAGSNASSPRSARGDVEIGGGRSAAAAGAVEDAPEEQRRDAPSPEEDGGASAGGDGDGDAYRLVPLETPREKSDAGFPSRGDAEASRGEPFDEASSSDGARSEADDAGAPFAATPLAFKQQVAALAVATASSEENPASEEAMVAGDRLEREISPPRGRLSLSTPAATSNGFLPLSNPPSNFRTGGLFPGSLAETPDPMLADTNVCDFALLNDEVNAAASTASAMQYRPDGFESGALLPQYAPDDAGLYGAAGAASTSTAMTPGGWMDVGQFSRYPMPDAFSLPPYVQAHLDETYAASTVVFPPDRGGDGNVSHHGNVFFQVTAYRPGSDGRSAPGNTPPAVAGPPRGKALAQQQPGGLPANKPAAKRKGGRARPRPLPLRKRKLQANYDAGDVEYSPPPPAAAGKNKRVLVRHNIRGGEGEGRVTCRCSKSKCLKLYCDCFQQRKLCSSACECKGCKNTQANSGKNGLRTKAIEAVLLRRPDAFEPRTRDANEGCRCKKNKCLKKYCICFNAGKKCDFRCRCKDCENQPEPDDTNEGGVTKNIAAQPPAQYAEAAPKFAPKHVPSKRIFLPEPVPSAVDSPAFEDSVYRQPPKLPGGYQFGLGSPDSQFGLGSPDSEPPAITEV